MLAAEGEQLSRQDGGPAGGVSDFADVAGDRAFHPELVEKQIAVAEDRGEKIIEVVRDAAGELTKRFHLLRADELILQLFPRGHIHERPHEANGRARGIADDQRAFEQIPIGTVAVVEPIFARPAVAFRGQRIANAGGRARPILGMNLLLPEADVAARGGTVISEQSFETLRPGKRAGFYIPIPNSIIRSPGNDRKMFRAFKRAAFRESWISFIFSYGDAWSLFVRLGFVFLQVAPRPEFRLLIASSGPLKPMGEGS